MLRELTESAALRAAVVMMTGVALVVWLGLAQHPESDNGTVVLALIEKSVLVLTTVGAVYLLLHASSRQSTQLTLFRSLLQAHARSVAWRARVLDLVSALSIAVDRQFRRWELSPTEREVALLLLKGLGYAEIALLQDRSERAVRRHARQVYLKANLDGHAAFAHYFLADLRPADISER